ncbi:Prephenate dehydratase [Macleaya cordata]|uniref:Prephenate dehydratase n=1 Tax=Macleaya cordata TaxID=56857 RepID=A0A200QUQ9_MACCD|nr:Prephenate dehydratase [Macleaya cordata]
MLNHLFSTKNRTGFQVPSALPLKNLQKRRRSPTILNSLNGSVRKEEVSRRLRVAYQGAPGAYSEFAAKTACPESITVPCRAFTNVISAVETGRADLAVLPVESTMEGTAVRNYDLLLQRDLCIVQEVSLFVHYCLLAMPGVTKGELKRVISHPMALAHCGRTLAQLGLDHEAVEDTAGAVELLLSNRMLDTAAIASSRAAVLYGLDVLAHGLQDESWNVTRFLILSRDPRIGRKKRVRVKTSMAVGHHSGTLSVLLKVLSTFSSRNISLTKLEVNPSSKNNGPIKILDVDGGASVVKEFPCVLYVDFEGSIDDQKVKDAIAEISELPVFVRILGCYSADPNIYGLQ